MVTCVTAVLAAVATRVRLLPEVVDISFIPTCAGVGSIAFVTYGAFARLSTRTSREAQLRRHDLRRHRRRFAPRDRVGPRCTLTLGWGSTGKHSPATSSPESSSRLSG